MIDEERLQDDLENLSISKAWTSVLEEVQKGSHENYADIARGLGDDGPRGESNTRRKASFFESQEIIYRENGEYKVNQEYLQQKPTP